MTFIHRSEITKERWTDTSYLRTDGKEEFREKKQFGNRHAVFDKGSQWGEVHYDKYNAIDVPSGTVNHFAKYTEEKIGIPQELVVLLIIVVGLAVVVQILRYLAKNIRS